MANAPVLKTGGRKPLGVRVPRPPFLKRVLIPIALAGAACGGGAGLRAGDTPDPCPDHTVYSYKDTLRGVSPPFIVHTTLPRLPFNKVTVQGVVNPEGRIERGTVRTFGADIDGLAGDALFWSQFSPARKDGCAVRFLYRITYVAGLPQAVPEEVGDTTTPR